MPPTGRAGIGEKKRGKKKKRGEKGRSPREKWTANRFGQGCSTIFLSSAASRAGGGKKEKEGGGGGGQNRRKKNALLASESLILRITLPYLIPERRVTIERGGKEKKKGEGGWGPADS